MIVLISICNIIFHITRIIRARNVQILCNIKPKTWSDTSGSWSKVLVHSEINPKCNKKLLEKVVGITKCDSYYKV